MSRIYGENSRPTFLNIEFSLHLPEGKTRGERKSRRGVFLITQIYTEATPRTAEPSEFSEQGKPGGKALAREPGPSAPLSSHLSTAAICLFSSHRCNPRTKCYPCSLTLISRMQYNREHNLEIARIIPAMGLIKACVCRVYIYLYRVFRNYGNQLEFPYCAEGKNYRN